MPIAKVYPYKMIPLLMTILLSILPISELRGGMIYAVLNGINPYSAFIICTLANILIIVFVFFFLDYLHGYFMKFKIYRNIFGYFHERAKNKAESMKSSMLVYGYLALALFVAIPLPATGAWSGCLIAWLLGLERKKSILAISLGVLAAGIIVLLVILTGTKLFGIA